MSSPVGNVVRALRLTGRFFVASYAIISARRARMSKSPFGLQSLFGSEFFVRHSLK